MQPVHRPLPALFNDDGHRLDTLGDALTNNLLFRRVRPRQNMIDAALGRLPHAQPQAPEIRPHRRNDVLDAVVDVDGGTRDG